MEFIYKTFEYKGDIIEFYIKPENTNLSFRIKDNEELTIRLVNDCNKKTIKTKNMFYAFRGIKEKLDNLK